MNNGGWIKTHRKILNKGFWKKSQYVHLWFHLLLNSNHKTNEFVWNGRTIILKEGQFITGRKQLSEETGIPETTIERILSFFEKEAQIGQQKTTKFRLITIINWKIYQNMDNRRTTDGQQTDTNKNYKKYKNDKNYLVAKATSEEKKLSVKNKKMEQKENKIKNYEIPDWLDKEVWEDWKQYKKERKQKFTPLTIKRQLKLLSEHQADHKQIINNSIQNGWTGLFPLKGNYEKQKVYKNTNQNDDMIEKLKAMTIKCDIDKRN